MTLKKESSLEGYNYLDQVLFVILNENDALSRITVHKPKLFVILNETDALSTITVHKPKLESEQSERKYNVPRH